MSRHRGPQQLFAVVGPDEPELVTRHGQRRHFVLVNEQATPVGAAIRENLQVREINQGATGERLIVGEEAPLDLDEEVAPPLLP